MRNRNMLLRAEQSRAEQSSSYLAPHRSERKRSSLWAVRVLRSASVGAKRMPLACSTAPRLARPLHTVRIRPASKLAGPNFDSMRGC